MTARWKRAEIKAMLAMFDKHEAGASFRQIAEEHGCSVAQAQTWVGHGKRYRDGQAMLAANPKSIDGLILTGKLPLAGCYRHTLVKEYGLTTLDDLTGWSRRELVRLQNIGQTKVDHIEAAMAEFGLLLRSDGEWVEHEWCAEYLAEQGRRQTEREQNLAKHDWVNRDRQFIIDQARAVANIWGDAYRLLKNNRDDAEAFAVIASALQKSPAIANPIYDEVKRIEEAEQSEAARVAAMEEAATARDAASRRLVELVMETGTACGKVIAFPLSHARSAEARP